ncbi:unnamed protein product, partial [marine sediment metagenome]
MNERGRRREKWSRFCPKCGKKTDELFDSLCKECFTKDIRLIEAEELEIKGVEIDIAVANLKPRLRMICLYYFANKLNYLV